MFATSAGGFTVDTNAGDATSLGAWAGDEFASTAQANAGIGSDADLPPDVRFRRAIAKLVRLRLGKISAGNEQCQPAIFLLEPNARSHKDGVKPKREPMLSNGLVPVCGRLWYVSEVAASGKYVELDDSQDDDALFTLVTDVLRLGAVPAIVFDPRTNPPSLRFYSRGLGDPDTVETTAVSINDVTLDCIFEAVENIYRRCLITPQVHEPLGKLWENSQNWWPVAQAERVIQMHLRHGLSGALPTCVVRREQADISGRVDLEIEEQDILTPGTVIRHAILELKVLRSYHSTGTRESEQDVRNCVKSGVEQAASYCVSRGAKAAALCCFDMRMKPSGEQCFEQVRDLAKALAVALKVWFLFATSERYRKFLTPQRLRQRQN